jgi:hypothetical protein
MILGIVHPGGTPPQITGTSLDPWPLLIFTYLSIYIVMIPMLGYVVITFMETFCLLWVAALIVVYIFVKFVDYVLIKLIAKHRAFVLQLSVVIAGVGAILAAFGEPNEPKSKPGIPS